MILTYLILCLIGLAWTDTAVGRSLHEALVRRPARKPASVSRGKVAFWMAMAVAALLAFLLFEFEGLRLFGLMAPEAMTWFVVFDVGVFFDALIIAVAVASVRGWRFATLAPRRLFIQAGLVLARARRAARALRRQGARKSARPSDDSLPRPVSVQAGYFAFSMA